MRAPFPLSILVDVPRLQRQADTFDDVASALDAGLPADTILKDQATRSRRAVPSLEHGFVHALARVIDLGTLDRTTLEAAETAGQLTRALRDRASDARDGATFRKSIVRSLIYPLGLLSMAMAVVGALTSWGLAVGWLPLVLGLGLPAGLATLAAATVWHVQTPMFRPAVWGPIGALVRDAAELPYLRALRSLYAAGIRIDLAHNIAAASSPIPAIRSRLVAAAAGPRSGTPLVEALARHDALHTETIRLLEPAQTTGELEDALARAATRRNERLRSGMARLAAAVHTVAYVIAALTVASLVFAFYSRLFARAAGL